MAALQNSIPITAPSSTRKGSSEPQKGPTNVLTISHSPITPSRSPAIPAQIGTPPNKMLDLRLFHHYIEMTSGGYLNTFRNGIDQSTSEVRATWFNWIVGLAHGSPNLMDAVLSLAAFHLRYLNAGDKAVADAGHRYMTRAIGGHGRQLREGINADNAEEIFATSTCVAFYVSSGRHIQPSGEQDLTHWFQSWQGMRAVLQSCWHLISNSKVKNIIHQEHTQELLHAGTHNSQDQPLDTFDFLIDDLAPCEVDPETQKAYQTSVRYLNKMYSSPENRNILKFPGIVTKQYVDLVAAKDPRALTILGYYFMLIIQVEQIWWLQGAVERDFPVLMNELPEIWKPRMVWAMAEFERYKDLGLGFNLN
jgi:hypothetical protein